ncbi:MAG: hypothetical protein MJE66_12520 [Proteobacteria bacterium]|nr:hypothetical protein [Pseudomonadota bacterium]
MSAIALLYFVLTAIVAGRLLTLAAHTRKLPEFLAGIGIFVFGCVGVPMVSAARLLPLEAAITAQIVGGALNDLGFLCIYLFAWRVFRPNQRWPLALIGLGTLALAGKVISQAQLPNPDSVNELMANVHGFALFGTSANVVLCGWAGAEALRYHGLMRRRMRLGLAGAVVTNRFLLFAVAVLSLATTLVLAAAVLLLDVYERYSWLMALPGLAATIAFWLGFAPPRPYLRWVATHQPPTSTAVGRP